MTDTKILTFGRTLNAGTDLVTTALTSPQARMVWGTPDAEMVLLIRDQPAPAPGVREISTCGPADNPYVTVRTDWIEITYARVTYAETLEAEGEIFATSLAIFDLSVDRLKTHLTATIMVASFAGEEVLPEVEGGWTHSLSNLETFIDDQQH